MSDHKRKMQSRRDFLGISASALVATTLLPLGVSSCSSQPTAPVAAASGLNSNFGGVQIGAITYSWRSMPAGLENIIKYCKESGISSVELMSGDLESFLGAPESPMRKIRMSMPPPQPGQRPTFTPEQQAEIEKYNADIKQWRVNLPIESVAKAKKLFDDAGINVHIVKFSPENWSDEEIDYSFKVTKAMGAKAGTNEISLKAAKRLGPFAEKHGMYIALHNHMQYAEPDFDVDAILAASPAVMLNFDAGHYFGSTGKHPADFIRKYHDRIYSIHIKDKTGPNVEEPNANQVFGQGQMPIADVLLLLQKEKWPIYVDIELEYTIKPWSDAVKEVRNCVNFLREILV